MYLSPPFLAIFPFQSFPTPHSLQLHLYSTSNPQNNLFLSHHHHQATTIPTLTPAVHVTEVTYPSTHVKEVTVMHGGVAGSTVRADRIGLVGRGRILRHHSPNSSQKSGVDAGGNGQMDAGVYGSPGMQGGTMGVPVGRVGANGRPPSPEWGNWDEASVCYDELMTTRPLGGISTTTNGSTHSGSGHHSGNGHHHSSTTIPGMVTNGGIPRGYRRRLDLSAIKLFIGISGPYNLQVITYFWSFSLKLSLTYCHLILIVFVPYLSLY